MKGWVYIITNAAMPGLIKIGFTMNDPEIRARDLNHTGSPHPYIVAYEILIDEPHQIEQDAHRLMASKREGKEWFRCNPEEGVAAIKQIAGHKIITETYKLAERVQAEAIFRQQEDARKKMEQERMELNRQQNLEREAQAQKLNDLRKKQEADSLFEQQLVDEELAVRKKYDIQFKSDFPPWSFFFYWLAGLGISCAGILTFFYDPHSNEGSGNLDGLLYPIAISSFLIGVGLRNYIEEARTRSDAYTALERQRDNELNNVRYVRIPCKQCGGKIRLDRKVHRKSAPGTAWTCASCVKFPLPTVIAKK